MAMPSRIMWPSFSPRVPVHCGHVVQPQKKPPLFAAFWQRSAPHFGQGTAYGGGALKGGLARGLGAAGFGTAGFGTAGRWTAGKCGCHGGGDLKGGSEGPRVPWGSEARSMAAASALPRDLAVGRHRGVSKSSSWLTRALRGPASRRAAANEAQRCCSRPRCCSSRPRCRSCRRAPRRWRT